MEATGSATAMLVGTLEDVGGRPNAATVTLAREEIQEALASDLPLELILTVDRGGGAPQDVRVAWERTDLEKVLAGTDDGGITFSFDRAELDRTLEADFEGHGIREMMMLTVAAASASAALVASTASGQVMEGTGSTGETSVAVVQPGDPGTIPYMSQGAGVDQSVFQGEPTAQPTAQPGDPGISLELPSVDAGTAAAIGGLAGATLIIGAAFAVRRQRVGPA
jgi:hypothetical protein